MFVPIKATVKLPNGNTIHAQGIGILVCIFPKCHIICPLGPVYYCPGHHYNTISSGSLKLYVGFKKVISEPFEHCDFVDPQGHSWRSSSQTQNNLDSLQIEIFRVNPQRYGNTVVPTLCDLAKQNISCLITQRFSLAIET